MEDEKFLQIAAVQYPVPNIHCPEEILPNTENICIVVERTKRFYPNLDVIVFPEYSTQNLDKKIWAHDDMCLTLDSVVVQRLRTACETNRVWGVFSIIEKNPDGGMPYNSAIVVNDRGELVLHYRKLQPWCPIEPWAPGNFGMPVCDGPKGSKLAVCVCHDGMFPEIAREAAYKGCNVFIRISAYTSQWKEQWILTNRANAWNNLMFTVSVNLAGQGATAYHCGNGMICDIDGRIMAIGSDCPGEIVTAEIDPSHSDYARKTWGVENNIFNLGCRAYIGKPGGEKGNYLTWVKDLENGAYCLPWDGKIKIR